MDSPQPRLASSPRSPPLPAAHPLHGQATGAPMGSPPAPMPATAPCSASLSELPPQRDHAQQATGAPPPTETPPPPPAEPSPPLPPYTAEWIFRDYTCRRAALIRALTLDEKKFSRNCRQGGTETLYLYGNSDVIWEVRPTQLLMAPTQRDPRTVGIKLDKCNMRHPKWLGHIAKQCDSWLMQICSFLGANLTTSARQRLSARINSLQTVHESFIDSDAYRRICSQQKMNEEIDDGDEGCGTEPTICGSCGTHYCSNGFWICCDVCDRWFHGKCVKVTSAQADHIRRYECPECRSEKKGHAYDADPMLCALYKRY
ncbi:hypothetical protein U9M48_043722 [Paspalum notatum var. saurae]|uniref:PHD finger protein ALFIN-LIKE n=1 Tax=Paspalum notatum var. saurae TaxID=547442 RepID=A0AAQ3UXG9_PASNO